MSILSHAEYLNRWTAPAPNGFGQTICPPCYHEYLQREVYFNDYLDLFRNVITFNRIPHLDRFYVPITGCPILGVLDIPEHELYTINIDGIVYLLVDYDYPWSLTELKKKRCIKYVMFGECARPLNPTILVNGDCNIPNGDNNNTYFYNILHLSNTPYLNAPRSAFGCPNYRPCPENKIETLLCLASKGVLLLDIFPFAKKYNTTFRNYLNDNGITEYFFNELITLISIFRRKYKCDKEVLACFVAPPIISHFLANIINSTIVSRPVSFRLGTNTFNPPHFHHDDLFFNDILIGTELNGCHGPVTIPSGGRFTFLVPIYCCSTYDGSKQGPHYLFIQNALCLI